MARGQQVERRWTVYRTHRPSGAITSAVAAAVVAVFVVASAPPAAAHTALEASSPKDGGSINVAPGKLVLKFTEPILTVGYRVIVLGPDNSAYQTVAPQIVDNKLTQPLKPLGPAGPYRVEFRIVAYDGHPLTGGIRFTLTKPGPAAGGTKAITQSAPLYAVSSNTVNNAPPWAPWTATTLAIILASGAVLFGRRATRDLN
jgi:copper resistance protein C